MAAPTIKKLRQRLARCAQYRGAYDQLLRECYDYIIPFRNAGFGWGAKGESPRDVVFDATATKAAFRFAGRMQKALTPPGEEFFALELGPAGRKRLGGDATEADRQLLTVGQMVRAGLSSGGFDMAALEMYLDLFAGTGGMLILKGDESRPFRCVSVPINELALERGPYGIVSGRHWLTEWDAGDLQEAWPEGTFSAKIKDAMAKESDRKIRICESFTWDEKEKRWQHVVFAQGSQWTEKDDDRPIWTEQGGYRSCPLITPRFMVVPGEVMGRGPGTFALPSIKTMNKARELALKAAAFGLLGLWMRRDDMTFNPDTAEFKPGAMWLVGQTGDALMGPSLRRLDVPNNFDISHVVMEDERMQIKQLTFDDTLPPETGPVRSPTEILERIKLLIDDFGGIYGRMQLEIVEPVVQRGIDILSDLRAIEGPLKIDQLNLGLRIVSPIAAAQGADRAKRVVDWSSLIAGMFGPEMVPVFMNVEKAAPDLARYLGVPVDLVRSEEEAGGFRQQVMEMVANKIAERQMAENPQAGAAAPEAVSNGAANGAEIP